MSFDYLHLFRPSEHSEDYHFRKPIDENFLFEIEDKNYIHVAKNLFSFETNDESVEYSFSTVKNEYQYLYKKR